MMTPQNEMYWSTNGKTTVKYYLYHLAGRTNDIATSTFMPVEKAGLIKGIKNRFSKPDMMLRTNIWFQRAAAAVQELATREENPDISSNPECRPERLAETGVDRLIDRIKKVNTVHIWGCLDKNNYERISQAYVDGLNIDLASGQVYTGTAPHLALRDNRATPDNRVVMTIPAAQIPAVFCALNDLRRMAIMQHGER